MILLQSTTTATSIASLRNEHFCSSTTIVLSIWQPVGFVSKGSHLTCYVAYIGTYMASMSMAWAFSNCHPAVWMIQSDVADHSLFYLLECN